MKKILTPAEKAENRELRRTILDNIMSYNGHSPKACKKIKIKEMDDYSLYMSKGMAKIKFPVDSSTANYQSVGSITEQGVMSLSVFIQSPAHVEEGKTRRKVKIALEDLFTRRRVHSIQSLCVINNLSKCGDSYKINCQFYLRLKRLPTREEFAEIIPTVKRNLVLSE
jgi:hypothetical protein